MHDLVYSTGTIQIAFCIGTKSRAVRCMSCQDAQMYPCQDMLSESPSQRVGLEVQMIHMLYIAAHVLLWQEEVL